MAITPNSSYTPARPTVRSSNAALYWVIAIAILVVAAMSWSFSRDRSGDSATKISEEVSQTAVGRSAIDKSSAGNIPETSIEPGTGTGIATGLQRGTMRPDPAKAAPDNLPDRH
ncbi:hypothetical protein BH10BDE1_BH10BDE1_31040 [soil metagenome]